MTGITTLKVLTLITKLYTGYAYSLAFIFQSSLVLILAALSTLTYIFIKEKALQKSQSPSCNLCTQYLARSKLR